MNKKTKAQQLYLKANRISDNTNKDKEDAALTLLTEAFSLDPLNPNVNHDLANLYRQKGDHDKEEDHLLRAAPFAKHPEMVYEGLALLYLRTGELGKARVAAEKAVELNPDEDDPSPQTTLTQVYLQAKDYQAALQSVLREKELSELGPDAASVIPMARALEGLGRPQEAIDSLRTGTTYEHVEEQTYYYLADLLFKTSDCTQAEMYALILEGIATATYEPNNDPFDVQLYRAAAVLCAAQGDVVNQARFLIRAELNSPKEPFTRKDDIARLLGEAQINESSLRNIFELEFRFSKPQDQKDSELLQLLAELDLLHNLKHQPAN